MSDKVQTSLSNTFNSAISSINPLAHTINKGFHQVFQFAGEKIGAVEKTELPQEYLQLEQRVDKLRAVYENMVKLSACQIQPGSFTQIKFSLYDVVHNVTETIGTDTIPTERLKEINTSQNEGNQTIVSQYCQAGIVVGESSPFGSSLIKTGELHEKVGKLRSQMNSEVNSKVVRRMNEILNSKFKNVYALRRMVHNSRLNLDSLKSVSRMGSTVKQQEIEEEISKAEEQYKKYVEDATRSMKSILSSNDGLACLADYHAALLKYYQGGYELLAELSPEIDAIKVTQEALSNSN